MGCNCFSSLGLACGSSLLGGYHTLSVYGAPTYYNVFVNLVSTVNDILNATVMPVDGIASRIVIYTDVPPGIGETLRVTLLKNTVATPLFAEISGAADISARNLIDKALLLTNDTINFAVLPSAGCASSFFQIGCLLQM